MNGYPEAMDVESRNFKSYEQVPKWWSRLISAGVIAAVVVAVIALAVGSAALKEAKDNDTESTVVSAPTEAVARNSASDSSPEVVEETAPRPVRNPADSDRPLPGSPNYAGYQHVPAPPSRLYFDVVTHGHVSESYFNLLQKGIDDAAQSLGVDVAYHDPERANSGGSHEEIVESIVEARQQLRNGLAISFLEHEQEISEAVEEASYDMPVLSMLLDADEYEGLDLRTFVNVGFSNEFAGFEAGRVFRDAGVDTVLCLKTAEDVSGEETACTALDQGLGGTVVVRSADLSDEDFVRDTIENTINRQGVRAILTLTEPAFDHALTVVRDSQQLCTGSQNVNNSDCIMLATFGESNTILQAIVDGEIAFAVDQQHYMHGYLAIMFLKAQAQLHNSPGVGRPVLTGPVMIDTVGEARRRLSRDIMESETIDGREARDLKIRFLVHGKTSDPFWTAVKNGVRLASRETGVGIDFRHPDRAITSIDGIVQWQIEMLELAERDSVDALVMTLPSNDTDLVEAVQQLHEATNLPIYSINAGHRWFRDLHVRAHVGTANRLDGISVGSRLRDANVQKALCVIVEKGNADLEERCSDIAGDESGVEIVILDSFEDEDFHADMPDRTNVIKEAVVAALTEDLDLKAVVSTGLLVTQGVREAIDELERFCLGGEQPRRRDESCVEFAAYDVDPIVYSYIKSGELLFAVDQQPVLQGYIPIYLAMIDVLYANRGFGIFATGPAFIDLSNVEIEEEFYGFLRV